MWHWDNKNINITKNCLKQYCIHIDTIGIYIYVINQGSGDKNWLLFLHFHSTLIKLDHFHSLSLTGSNHIHVYKIMVFFRTGSNHMYVLMNPLKPQTADESLPKEIDWEFAQREIAQVKGFSTASSGLTKGLKNLICLNKLLH